MIEKELFRNKVYTKNNVQVDASSSYMPFRKCEEFATSYYNNYIASIQPLCTFKTAPINEKTAAMIMMGVKLEGFAYWAEPKCGTSEFVPYVVIDLVKEVDKLGKDVSALQDDNIANKKDIALLKATVKVLSELSNVQTAILNQQAITNSNQEEEINNLKREVALFKKIICIEMKYDCAGLMGKTENGADKLNDLSGHDF